MTELTADTLSTELARWFRISPVVPEKADLTDRQAFSSAIEIFREDYRRYYDFPAVDLRHLRLRAELQGILLYRIARYYFLAGNESADEYAALGRFLSGFELYYSASIGEGLKINHGLGTVVGARSVIGKNAMLHHQVTLGEKNGRPTLGDRVTVYPGAVIIGNIHIGNDCIVAANTVCLSDAPAGSVIKGVPGKISAI